MRAFILIALSLAICCFKIVTADETTVGPTTGSPAADGATGAPADPAPESHVDKEPIVEAVEKDELKEKSDPPLPTEEQHLKPEEAAKLKPDEAKKVEQADKEDENKEKALADKEKALADAERKEKEEVAKAPPAQKSKKEEEFKKHHQERRNQRNGIFHQLIDIITGRQHRHEGARPGGKKSGFSGWGKIFFG